MELSSDAQSAIVLLITFRLRNSKCSCHSKYYANKDQCARCFLMDRVKKEFPSLYGRACEIIAENPGHPSYGN
jgi:hypothetical protein